VALEEITQDMSATAYAQEIMAEDRDEAPGALWKHAELDEDRVGGPRIPRLDERPYTMIVVGVDPSASSTGDECGIIVVGAKGPREYYVLDDLSRQDSPLGWGRAVLGAYHQYNAHVIVYEGNQGGEMAAQTLRGIEEVEELWVDLPLVKVSASEGKAARAQPIAVLYGQHQVHHVKVFEALENELCLWEPGSGKSPNRLDALVWAMVGCRDRARATKARAYS
jgi:phage terminase large subunit-like protein